MSERRRLATAEITFLVPAAIVSARFVGVSERGSCDEARPREIGRNRTNATIVERPRDAQSAIELEPYSYNNSARCLRLSHVMSGRVRRERVAVECRPVVGCRYESDHLERKKKKKNRTHLDGLYIDCYYYYYSVK